MANLSHSRIAGALLLFGAAQFLLLLVAAESLYPDYSVSKNFISDLGVGQTTLLFNASIFLFGLCVLAAAYFRSKDGLAAEAGGKAFSILLGIAGIGACGVGIFPETAGALHLVGAFVVFFFGAAAAVYSGARMKMPAPFSWFSISLGLISLAALSLSVSGQYFGLGAGGMERMVAYPIIAWCICYSGTLLAKE
jgi:hypothetical membrane protein